MFFLALNNRAVSLVASARIDRLLNIKTVEELSYHLNPDKESRLKISNGEFSWKNEQQNSELENSSVLKNINVEVSNEEFVAIIGKVGAGKSSILLAMMKELSLISGEVDVNGSIAYIP